MKNIDIQLSGGSYNIIIDHGLIKEIGSSISKIYNGDKVAIITDEKVNKYYGDIVEKSLKAKGYNTLKIVIPPGETSKSVESLLKLYSDLLEFKINRGNLIVALGGGVIGDLTGFCASTLLRGIPFIQIPTSLLAQIDSSIGGKVAVDLPQGKNLIGNFYHPKAVYIDPEVLNTLDKKFINDGLGEVIKYGLIKDVNLFSRLEEIKDYKELMESMDYIIYTCCNIKKQVVQRDEKDTGERMILNFGHTIGHAIEKLQNYTGLSHGEAVAVGMYKITVKSEELGISKAGLSERIKNLLIKFNLPYEEDNFAKNELLEAINFDKKNINKNINLVLIKDIGESFIKNVPIDEIKKYL